MYKCISTYCPVHIISKLTWCAKVTANKNESKKNIVSKSELLNTICMLLICYTARCVIVLFVTLNWNEYRMSLIMMWIIQAQKVFNYLKALVDILTFLIVFCFDAES